MKRTVSFFLRKMDRMGREDGWMEREGMDELNNRNRWMDGWMMDGEILFYAEGCGGIKGKETRLRRITTNVRASA